MSERLHDERRTETWPYWANFSGSVIGRLAHRLPCPPYALDALSFFLFFFFFCSRDLYPEPCVVKRLKQANVGQSEARPVKGLTSPFVHGEMEMERGRGGGRLSGPIGKDLMHKQDRI